MTDGDRRRSSCVKTNNFHNINTLLIGTQNKKGRISAAFFSIRIQLLFISFYLTG